MPVETTERSELVNELLERIGQTVGRRAQASAVFGEPVQREDVTVIPVAKARWGMGGGSGAKSREARPLGSAGGGGAIVKPMGFLELAGGRTRFRPILDPGLVAGTAIATGLLGLGALQTVLASSRPSTRARLRIGKRRIGRRLRRLFR